MLGCADNRGKEIGVGGHFQAEGQERVRKLAAHCDALLEN